MELSADGRYFRHHFRDDEVIDTVLFEDAITRAISEIGQILREHTRTDVTGHQHGMYTGTLGVYYSLFVNGDPHLKTVIEQCPVSVFQPPTLLGGDMLPSISKGDYDALGRFAETATRLPSSDCELLYGRAGCLLGLIKACQVAGHVVHEDLMCELVEQIIASGTLPGSRMLMWKWHAKEYLGAVHGVAGILYALLACPRKILLRGDPGILNRIQATVEFVLKHYTFQSGNIRSSTTSASDRLVHFCHGATGWIPLLCVMSEEFPETRGEYVRWAVTFGEVVWERGLLATKGPGVCHGIGGSICGLMDVYRCTKDEKWYTRAQWFAFFLSREWRVFVSKADHAVSLFEGLAGAYHALSVVNRAASVVGDGFLTTFPCL